MDWFGGYNVPTRFEAKYYCRSTALIGRDVDEGDKIILPPSALDKLARMNVEYPMLFEISCNFTGRKSHCGVLEFSAEEGFCYMPFWMLENLAIEEGSLISVKNVSLGKAKFVKFRARSVDFLEVSNPRALLEVSLRKYTCLTVGDIICIKHGTKKFYMDVREVDPNGQASIIETDCNVDFEEPLGYKDSKYAQYERQKQEELAAAAASSSAGSVFSEGSMKNRVLQKAKLEDDAGNNGNGITASGKFVAFAGMSKRIDGRLTTSEKIVVSSPDSSKGSTPSANAMDVDSSTSTKSATGGFGYGNNNGGSGIAGAGVASYQPRIGDKFSKKKTSVSAFVGTARKLAD